jgi:hypothetical protein
LPSLATEPSGNVEPVVKSCEETSPELPLRRPLLLPVFRLESAEPPFFAGVSITSNANAATITAAAP